MLRVVLAAALVAFLAACGNDPGTRALSGGIIGAGAGALLGGSPGTGAVIGGAAGAVGGAVTAPGR